SGAAAAGAGFTFTGNGAGPVGQTLNDVSGGPADLGTITINSNNGTYVSIASAAITCEALNLSSPTAGQPNTFDVSNSILNANGTITETSVGAPSTILFTGPGGTVHAK